MDAGSVFIAFKFFLIILIVIIIFIGICNLIEKK